MIGLRKRLIQIVLLSGLLIAVAVGASATIFYFARSKWSFDQITNQMQSSVLNQSKDLAASFLIPEQGAGRELLLKKYIVDEKLSLAKVLSPADALPPEFAQCQQTNVTSRCKSADGRFAATLSPLSESDVVFGHLFKVREINDQEGVWIFRYASAAFLALVLVVVTIIVLISRVYSSVAASLETLEDWTGKVVIGEGQERSPLVQFQEFKILGENIKRIIDEGRKLKRQAVGSEIATAVAHDIRAPVMTLSVMIESLDESELSKENRDAVISAAQRINEIADSLIRRTWAEKEDSVHSQGDLSTTRLASAIETIVLEKRIQYRSRQGIVIDLNVEGFRDVVACADAVEIKRVLSNLMNNSIEAMDDSGRVLVSLSVEKGYAIIEIVDNGHGIPKNLLSRLGEKELTFGRKRGTGIGVYHAFKTVKSCGGNIEFSSTEGAGTSVKIALPISVADWSSSISTVNLSQVIVVDDDPAIHKTWDSRFGQAVDVLHFYSYAEVRRWLQRSRSSADRLFLIDYKLSEDGPTGLDLIEELGISEKSILVSNQCDDPVVQAKATKLGVRLLMKNDAGAAPILGDKLNKNLGGINGTA